ncbi:MFS transporter [Pseudarthrobacter sp. PvP090]|uniref:MFS transporter n=1 Tax=Pseudarthrobacter sp. PvP090 TaxID=3156393 RepID=UPI00339980BB
MGNGPDRKRAAGTAATFVGGSAELVDFLIPLWGETQLGLAPGAIGALVAVELVVSVIARPVSGWLVDTRVRTRVAAAGALLYAVSCGGYALASSLPLAFAAAGVGGVGGAFFWIAVRAIAAEDLDLDSGSMAGMLSSEALGSWSFWIPAMVLLPLVGFGGVFGTLSIVCIAAAVLLLRVPRFLVPPQGQPPGGIRGDGRRLAPLLAVASVTAVAEAGVSLLLLLHLQNALGLEVYQIALIYLPGGIVLTVMPRVLHRFVERRGRRTGYVIASVASAGTAAGLSFTPSPVVIAALWVLTSASWAILLPIQRAVVAEVNGHRVGRGLSLLTNFEMLGAAAGALIAGLLYEGGSWQLSCLIFAGIILSGTVLGPLALRKLGVRDRPGPDVAVVTRA